MPCVALAAGLLVDWVPARIWLTGLIVIIATAFHIPRVYLDTRYSRSANPSRSGVAFGVIDDPIDSFSRLREHVTTWRLGPEESLEWFVASWMAIHVDRRLSLATGQMGMIPYYTGLTVHDLVGLTWCQFSRTADPADRLGLINSVAPDLFLVTDKDLRHFRCFMSRDRYNLVRVFARRLSPHGSTPRAQVYYLLARPGVLRCSRSGRGDEVILPFGERTIVIDRASVITPTRYRDD